MTWGNIGSIILIGFGLALVLVALYGILFAKKEIDENNEIKRYSEMMAAQRQMWIEEIRRVRVARNALVKIRRELFIDREWEKSRAEVDGIADEALLYMYQDDVRNAASKEAE